MACIVFGSVLNDLFFSQFWQVLNILFFYRLAAMKRELRTRELQLLDKSRMRFVDHQQTMKKIEIKRLEEELRRKVSNSIDNFDFTIKAS